MTNKKRVRNMRTSKGLKTLVERAVAISMGGRGNTTRRCTSEAGIDEVCG